MNIRSGLQPIHLDKRDLSYHKSFPKFGGVPRLMSFADFNVDVGKTMPDQNADGLYLGCTGYTQTDNCTDESGSIYKAKYTYDKTCYMEGHGEEAGCQIRNSLKSTTIYGLQELAETTDQEAEQHRGGNYFNIYDDGGMDWFDGVLTAVKKHGKGASLGTPWFPSWSTVGPDGILPMPTVLELAQAQNSPYTMAWHNYSCKGQKTINMKPYLRIKSWQGPNIGDRGWLYMSREVANAVLEIRGAGAFIQAFTNTADKKTITLSLYEQVMIYLQRILGIIRLN